MSHDYEIVSRGKRVLPIRENPKDASILLAYTQKTNPSEHDFVGHTDIMHSSACMPTSARGIRTLCITEQNGRPGTLFADAHAKHNFDIVITIGVEATVRAIRELSLFSWQKLHIFVGIQKEQLAALYSKKIIPVGYPLRGVVEVYEDGYDTLVDNIVMLRKQSERVIVTIDSNEIIDGHDFGQYGMRSQIIDEFERRNIAVDYATVYPHKTKLSRSLQSAVHASDIVIMTNQGGSLAKAGSFVHESNRSKTTLVACGRSAIAHGASIGFGLSERDIAAQVISLVYDVSVRKLPAKKIRNRVLRSSNDQTWFNTKTIEKQNGKLPDDILRALKMLPIDVELKL